MSKEDAIKAGLVQVHAMLDRVQDIGESVISRWASAKEFPVDDPHREMLLMDMTTRSEAALDMVTKASVLASALCATLDDRRGKNAVLQDVLKKLSHGYGKLLRMQECLGDISGQ